MFSVGKYTKRNTNITNVKSSIDFFGYKNALEKKIVFFHLLQMLSSNVVLQKGNFQLTKVDM